MIHGFDDSSKDKVEVIESDKIVVKELVTDAIDNNTSTTKTFVLGLNDGDKVRVKVESLKSGIMSDVFVKVDPKFYYEMHIDTDDANAFMLKTGDVVEIEKY